MSKFSSKVRRWGFRPFIFRVPEKPNAEVQWIESQDFEERLSLELKRDFARVFRIPHADSLDDEDLMSLFCEHNERVPMLPLHEWEAGDSHDGRVIRRKPNYAEELDQLVTIQPRDLEVRELPWFPKRSAMIPKRLVPAEDEYEDSEDDCRPKKTAKRRPGLKPPVTIEHELVYPPRAPVVGRDKATGRDLIQPLSQDWLRVMLQEQEIQYEELRVELRNAVAAAREAAGEVALVRTMMKEAEKEFDDFSDTIEQICGPAVFKKTVEMAKFGAEYGFLEEGSFGDDDEEEEEEEEDNTTTTESPSLAPEKRRREDDDDGGNIPVGDEDEEAIECAEVERDIRPQKKRRISGDRSSPQPANS